MNDNIDAQQVFKKILNAPPEWAALETPEEREAAKDFMQWIVDNRNRESNITFHSSPAKGVTRAQIGNFKTYQ